jgi:hypothetical protein
MLKASLAVLGVLVAFAPTPDTRTTAGTPAFDADDVLARTYAAYVALSSYADSGTVVDESKGFQDRFAFRTRYTKQPRNYFLDFRYTGSVYDNGFKIDGQEQTVIWMQNGELQTWLSKTQAHETYPEDGGRQVEALTGASNGTRGISVLVPSLIYTKAGMASVVRATEDAVAAGMETLGGHPCFKVMGFERWGFPNGRVTGVRPITLWIDTETHLIRKVLEDTPKDAPRGSLSRRIITFHAQANPPLEASHFSFTVPES